MFVVYVKSKAVADPGEGPAGGGGGGGALLVATE